MEQAAVEKLDELITESQSESKEEILLFPLEQKDTTVEIEAGDDDFRLTLAHRIKWPTADALSEREQQLSRQNVLLAHNRIRSQSADGVAANAILWDKFRLEVKGYEWDGLGADEWVAVTDELAAEIPSEHKSAAIVGLLAAEFKVERPEGKGFVLGAMSYRVKQTYGAHRIYHVIGRHHERDRRELVNKSMDTQIQTGTTQGKSTTFSNLKPYIQFYDKFFVCLEGVQGADPNIALRKDLVNALWKKGVVDALMDFFEASRRDSGKN
jgi:hypothetical protein